MNAYLLLIPILLATICPIIIFFLKLKNQKLINRLYFVSVIATSIITLLFVILPPVGSAVLINFSSTLKVYLKIDGLGRVFAGMVSILWPFAFSYALGYMEEDNRKNEYYLFYILTFAVVLGISFSGNLITMYFFYELLTLVTLPLIMHAMSKEAKRATRFYLFISIFGSALAFMGIVLLQINYHTTEFVYGGYANIQDSFMAMCYLCAFFGFGVKACVFPFHIWLPRAGVAPTPTTALLHAVAVVKAGAFAIMRTTYYVFDFNAFNGSVIQTIVIAFCAFTIIYGSSMAAKQLHLKRRLAYSTVANISYILLGVVMASDLGLQAAVIHMFFHSFAKISLFFAVGYMNHHHIIYVDQLDGLAKEMPITFVSMLLAGLSLIGIPLFAGFLSKWYLAMACIEHASMASYIGIVALLISAFLTAYYILSMIIRGYFYPVKKENEGLLEHAEENNKFMLTPILTFALLSCMLGIFGNGFIQVIIAMLQGVI